MDKKNTLDSFDFILEYGSNLFLFFVWYNFILFRCLPYMSCTKSRVILFLLIFSILPISRFVLYQRSSKWVVISSIALPFGVYTYLAYRSFLAKSMNITIIVCMVVSAMYCLLAMLQRMKKVKNKRKVLLRRMKKCIFVTSSIFTIGFLVIMGPLFFKGILNGGSVIELNLANKKDENATIKANIEYLQKLKYEHWSVLSVKERLELMQCCADIECNYLGISEVKVVASNLAGEVLGAYDSRYDIIKLRLDLLIENGSSEDVLDTLLHECRHKYQHQLILSYNKADEQSKKLFIYKSVPQYAENFSNYYDGDDYEKYYNQACEKDARDYAEEGVEDYMRKIEGYKD